jgi:GH15 family glucan-1,4-alpha-glucosidase
MPQASTDRTVTAEPRRTDGYLPIEDYAAIGDGRTLALVGIDGSIDWMCVPELDSPSLFGALLDLAGGGSFSLAPALPFEVQRSYLPDTNVLQSEFTTAEGTVRVTEAVTLDPAQAAPWRELVRRVEGVSGRVPMEWRVRPRFAFGQESREPVRRADSLVYRYGELQVGVKAWGAGEREVHGAAVAGSFEIGGGEQALLALVASDDVALPSPDRGDIERRLASTIQLWREWVRRTTYDGPWKEAVKRSLLAIRLLADGRTGAIAAAGTTSLPEVIGGKRNYDYRFGWVRDRKQASAGQTQDDRIATRAAAGCLDLATAGGCGHATSRRQPRRDRARSGVSSSSHSRGSLRTISRTSIETASAMPFAVPS